MRGGLGKVYANIYNSVQLGWGIGMTVGDLTKDEMRLTGWIIKHSNNNFMLGWNVQKVDRLGLSRDDLLDRMVCIDFGQSSKFNLRELISSTVKLIGNIHSVLIRWFSAFRCLFTLR